MKNRNKNKGYHETRFFYWEIQLEKLQLTRDLKDDIIFYQGKQLLCKIYQGYCNPTTRTQATIVWFPEYTCKIIQVARIHARMIKFHPKKFMESIPYDKVNPEKIRQNKNCYNKVKKIENKLTRLREITIAGYL